MNKLTEKFLTEEFDIAPEIIKLVEETEEELKDKFDEADQIMEYNQYKILKAFQDNMIGDNHFSWNTGYGYNDPGREALEKVYSSIFHTEAALVRTNVVNGTHALAITLMGILRPGDELIYCTGNPYDTLEEVIGVRGDGMGSLIEYGIDYKTVDLLPDWTIDLDALRNAITDKTKMVSFQRSTGYSWRNAICVDEIKKATEMIHEINPNIICMADNCYGEFVETIEPTDVGVDVIAGSLIKNPGGGLALSGGYICGKKELIDMISYRMTCPGIGAECGLMYGQTRPMMQGLFMAPKVVNGALKGAMLCGRLYEKLGYTVCPVSDNKRSDIIQMIQFGDPDKVIAFCEGIQEAAPVESYVSPIPWEMPGYESDVIMAAGAFVQGSSIELSADAPLREPYNVYFQGGLTYEHSKMGVLRATDRLFKKDLLYNEL